MSRRNISPFLFDIKPTDAFGEVDVSRMHKLERTIKLERKKTAVELARLRSALTLQKRPFVAVSAPYKPAPSALPGIPAATPLAAGSHTNYSQRDTARPGQSVPDTVRSLPHAAGLEGHNFLPRREELLREIELIENRDKKLALLEHLAEELDRTTTGKTPHAPKARRISTWNAAKLLIPGFSPLTLRVGTAGLLCLLTVGTLYFGRSSVTTLKASLAAESLAAYRTMRQGIEAAFAKNFPLAEQHFADAAQEFGHVGGALRVAGKSLALIADTLSFQNETTSGTHVLDAAGEFAKAGENLAAYAAIFSKDGFGSLTPQAFITGYVGGSDLHQAKTLLAQSLEHLENAQAELARVDATTLPAEFRGNVETLQEKIPSALTVARTFAQMQDSLFDVFGYLGPRKYLVVFQNSAELRPTGGFIGSYALLDVLDGKLTKLFIDDVFNIDGQLVDKVIPPMPIQKISTAWSLHDANWFFDYPTSAKKIAWFYEKAGGATVDGVIALTPALLEDFLKLSGPLVLPGYDLTLTSENLRDELSYAIEEGQQKKDGVSPKVVLRDIGVLLMDQMQAYAKTKDGARTLFAVLGEALEHKEILPWVRNRTVEEFLAAHNWGGATRVSDGDYLAVVHTNINGYKTDRVLREAITHRAEINAEGEVIDTVTVERAHAGSPDKRYNPLYEKVNTDYLRVYVPKGSELIRAAGHTLQAYEPPINYAEAHFVADPDVERIEQTLRIDTSGTHIYDEAEKTVFANWVYVSPGESVKVTYTYKLPWRVKLDGSGAYAMLVQKQPGLEHTTLSASVSGPDGKEMAGDMPRNTPLQSDMTYRIVIP